MVYVQRDEYGRLLRVERQPFSDMCGTLAVEDEELQRWLNVRLDVDTKLALLRHSDLQLVRVLEDVINVLVERDVIRYTDLPVAAREKLDQRALVRAEIEGMGDHPEQ